MKNELGFEKPTLKHLDDRIKEIQAMIPAIARGEAQGDLKALMPELENLTKQRRQLYPTPAELSGDPFNS